LAKYRKILVAYDGSDSGKNALLQAIGLARSEKSWVKVVSVVPAYEGDIELTLVHDPAAAIKGPAVALLKEAKEIAEGEGVKVLTEVEQGEAYERIVDVAEAENCDLIVMGRKGHGRIEKALIGCVTERVIGYTHKDVLVVPKGAKVSMENILLATDGSKYSDAASMKAIDLAKSYNAGLTVASVVETNDEFLASAPGAVETLVKKAKAVVEGVRKRAAEAGVKAAGFVKEGDAFEAITGLAEDNKAGVIVLGSHGRTGLTRLLMGSVTAKVIGLAQCPVLVVRT
jgi:nucleotide-binding universal stress UspA family protein